MGFLKRKKKAFKAWKKKPVQNTLREIAKIDANPKRSQSIPNQYGDIKVNGQVHIDPATGKIRGYGIGIKGNIPL